MNFQKLNFTTQTLEQAWPKGTEVQGRPDETFAPKSHFDTDFQLDALSKIAEQ